MRGCSKVREVPYGEVSYDRETPITCPICDRPFMNVRRVKVHILHKHGLG